MSLAPPPPAAALPENQRRALISLLADEDPGVYETVRARLLACGQEAVSWLHPHLVADDPLLRRRAREITDRLTRREADEVFARWIAPPGRELNLEEGVWLLARTRYPQCHAEAYGALLDGFADELRRQIDPASHGEANLLAINQHLFQRLCFHGDGESYYAMENSYLNLVMDRRVGNPISLCTVYMLVAARLAVPVEGVGLPGHFLCYSRSGNWETYIDCFHGGRFLTREECEDFVRLRGVRPTGEHFAPVSARRMLLRMCANLHQAALRDKDTEETARIERYLTLLAG
jgi:regulator of sirC expression with transglutaminase-like and TPR domain